MTFSSKYFIWIYLVCKLLKARDAICAYLSPFLLIQETFKSNELYNLYKDLGKEAGKIIFPYYSINYFLLLN